MFFCCRRARRAGEDELRPERDRFAWELTSISNHGRTLIPIDSFQGRELLSLQRFLSTKDVLHVQRISLLELLLQDQFLLLLVLHDGVRRTNQLAPEGFRQDADQSERRLRVLGAIASANQLQEMIEQMDVEVLLAEIHQQVENVSTAVRERHARPDQIDVLDRQAVVRGEKDENGQTLLE